MGSNRTEGAISHVDGPVEAAPGKAQPTVDEGGALQRIELIEEELRVSKRVVERGRVVIRKHALEREEVAEVELRRDEVITRRVPRGVPVEAAPPVREEDGVLIIPVLEERLVLRTELVLVEELHVVTTSRTEVVREPVRLRSQRVEVTRLDAAGTVRANHEPE